MASVGTTSLLQNATFLQNAFITTFLSSLGLEAAKYILGECFLKAYFIRLTDYRKYIFSIIFFQF